MSALTTFEQELANWELDLRRVGLTKLELAARAKELERRLQRLSFMAAHSGARSEDSDKLAAQVLSVRAAIERAGGYEEEVKAKIAEIEKAIADPGRVKAAEELRSLDRLISDGQARCEQTLASLARAIEGLIQACETADKLATAHRLPGRTNRWHAPRISLSLKAASTISRRLNLGLPRSRESKIWAAEALAESETAEPAAVTA